MNTRAQDVIPASETETQQAPLRFVTAASLFDGHDAAINIMRRIVQGMGAEVIHLGHNRSVDEIVTAALHRALDRLGPNDEVGLRAFPTGRSDSTSIELVPVGPIGSRRAAIRRVLGSLRAAGGTPLHAAIIDAVAAATRNPDPRRITGVVVITDGYDENGYDRPSKSQVKRDMHALLDLGKQLIELSPERLKQLPLAERLYEAIREAQASGAPDALCMTPGPDPVIFIVDLFPGRIYEVGLDGKLLGVYGKSGKNLGEFGWGHAIACPSKNEIWVGELLNWRVQKLVVRQGASRPSGR